MSTPPLPVYSASDRRLARMVVRPVQRFMQVEAASGIVLLAATCVALVWANSPWRDAYHELWSTVISIRVGDLLHLEEPLEAWVNDALMAVFFFVVGLEIKRELVTGELQDRRAVALPGLAALGGMIVPALVYLSLNASGDGAHGWGIPMATDIAFAVGVLALLGSRVPPSLKLFLLTLAIVDDIGAIAVIAVFYTDDLSMGWLAVAVALVGATYVARRLHVWYLPVYVLLGGAVWLAVFESGIHATIAGVVLGLITPARPLTTPPSPEELREILADDPPSTEQAIEAAMIVRESAPVAERLERVLHPWSTYVIIPIFALANAGVELSRESLGDAVGSTVTIGVFLGLVVGKLVGVSAFTLGAARSGLAPLPAGASRRHVVGAGGVAGIGFTVALFITTLAFDDPVLADDAKIGILAASVVAAIIGSLVLSSARRAGAARAARAATASDDHDDAPTAAPA